MKLTPERREQIRNLSSDELAEAANTFDRLSRSNVPGLEEHTRNNAEVHAAILNEMHRRS